MWLFPIVELTALPKSLSWISGDILRLEKGGKGKKGGERESKKNYERNGTKHPQIKVLVKAISTLV